MQASAARRLAPLLAVIGVVLAYANSFRAPFLFDDIPAVVDNVAIRRLWPISSPLLIPRAETVAGRPLLNLSLALNQAFFPGRIAVYHVTNLLIHVLAGAVLFGLVGRTLRRVGAPSAGWAAGTALLWAAHPLQTESVTYIIQRAESLMALLYLTTLYAFVRATEPDCPAPARWRAVAVAACAAGMATKEVMVSAPLAVLLWDRTFVAGSFAAAWRRRRRFYLALAGTWLVLAGCVAIAGNRGGSAGFGTGLAWWRYALLQCRAVPHYLQLAVWPSPLVFYYGPLAWPNFTLPALPTIIGAAAGFALVSGVISCLRRHPPLGLLGAIFLLVLAPSSSIVPIATEAMAEHRMYLPLATVAVAAGLGLRRLGRAGAAMLGTMIAAFLLLTFCRNRVYASATAIWADTVQHRPQNFTAHNAFGVALQDAGKSAEAEAEFHHALQLQPHFADPWINLGRLAHAQGREAEAMADFRQALRLNPDDAKAHNNIASLLLAQPGQVAAAEAELRRALQLRPGYAEAHNNLGNALAADPGRRDQALEQYRTALYLKPDYAEARYNLGNLLAADQSRLPQAVAEYETALAEDPTLEKAEYNLGNAFARLGRSADAVREYRRALQLDPKDAAAHFTIATLLARDPAQRKAAIEEFRAVLALAPRHAAAHANLGAALFQEGDTAAAIRETEIALQCDPALDSARHNLAAFRSATER